MHEKTSKIIKTKEGYRLEPSYQETVFGPLEDWAKAHGLKTRDYLTIRALKLTMFYKDEESELFLAWQLYETGKSPKRDKLEGLTLEELARGLRASQKALAEWLAGEEKALNAVIGGIIKETEIGDPPL